MVVAPPNSSRAAIIIAVVLVVAGANVAERLARDGLRFGRCVVSEYDAGGWAAEGGLVAWRWLVGEGVMKCAGLVTSGRRVGTPTPPAALLGETTGDALETRRRVGEAWELISTVGRRRAGLTDGGGEGVRVNGWG